MLRAPPITLSTTVKKAPRKITNAMLLSVVGQKMIAGKSGLGYFTWASYVGGNYPQIVVGMLSIGIAGYLSSGLIRAAGKLAAPWQRRL